MLTACYLARGGHLLYGFRDVAHCVDELSNGRGDFACQFNHAGGSVGQKLVHIKLREPCSHKKGLSVTCRRAQSGHQEQVSKYLPHPLLTRHISLHSQCE